MPHLPVTKSKKAPQVGDERKMKVAVDARRKSTIAQRFGYEHSYERSGARRAPDRAFTSDIAQQNLVERIAARKFAASALRRGFVSPPDCNRVKQPLLVTEHIVEC